MSHELKLALPKHVDAFHELSPAVASFLDTHAIAGQPAYVVNLALEEMVMNLIQHSSTAGIDVVLTVIERRVLILIEDDGDPYDPRDGDTSEVDKPFDDRRAGGMGLHLIQTMVDEMHYDTVEGRNRLRIAVSLEATI